MEQKDWYVTDGAETIDSPALIFYPDRIIENISRLKNSIEDISRLRPHVKTHKNAEITSLMLHQGIMKFKCATISEAEMLGICKAPDVLLAYQPVGPKLERFTALISSYPSTTFSCLADNEVSLRAIAAAALQAGITISVFLDLNVGMNRTGIIPGYVAAALYERFSTEPGIRMLGLHAYDGHIHDSSSEVRKEKVNEVLQSLYGFRELLRIKGLPEPVIVAGGTPTYPFYAQESDIECSPGTFVLWDKGYQEAFREQDYLTAALVLTRVISVTDEKRITVDLGHKAVAAENELHHRVFFLNAPQALVISQSEEHLVLEPGSGHGFKIGDILYGLPVHICPTVALYQQASAVDPGRPAEEWKIISRDRKINI